MNHTNTSSAIYKLESILIEDINTLQQMLSNKPASVDIVNLIESLIDAKKHIISLIPKENITMKMSPNTPQGNQPTTHSKTHKSVIKDNMLLPKIFLEIENDQSKFVQDAMILKGIPDGIKQVFEKIMKVYNSIINQLERSSKTHQVNAIII